MVYTAVRTRAHTFSAGKRMAHDNVVRQQRGFRRAAGAAGVVQVERVLTGGRTQGRDLRARLSQHGGIGVIPLRRRPAFVAQLDREFACPADVRRMFTATLFPTICSGVCKRSGLLQCWVATLPRAGAAAASFPVCCGNRRRPSLLFGLDESRQPKDYLSIAVAPLGIAAEKHASYGIMADAAPTAPRCKAPDRVLLRQPELMPCAWPSCVLAASADDVNCIVRECFMIC